MVCVYIKKAVSHRLRMSIDYAKLKNVLYKTLKKPSDTTNPTESLHVNLSASPHVKPPAWNDLISANTLEVIPKILHQTWYKRPLPKHMHQNATQLQIQNPDFQYCFYSDKDCRSFIKTHFPTDVLFAFDHLRPGAFRADLFRYCVLYILGGVYLDIKFSCASNFKLKYLCYQEHVYVRDRDVSRGTAGVYQGLLVSLPLNPILGRAIRDVVYTACTEEIRLNPGDPLLSSGARCLAYTGPLLLAQYFLEYDKARWNFRFDDAIFYKDQVIFTEYEQYRLEQHNYYQNLGTRHYRDLCNQGLVYNTPCLKTPEHLFSRDEKRVFKSNGRSVLCYASQACILYNAQRNCYTMVQRWVNYKYNPEGDLKVSPSHNQSVSCNTLVILDAQLQNIVQETILSDEWDASRRYPFNGVEDVRLYQFRDSVYMTGTKYCPHHECPRAVFGVFDGVSVIAPLVVMPFDVHQWQKNWALCTYRDQLALVYKWFPLTVAHVKDGSLEVLHIVHDVPKVLSEARGSSAASRFGGHVWFVVHRTLKTSQGRRLYQHMFVVLDATDFTFCGRSQYFTFTENNSIEFCLGLIVNSSSVVVSYSAGDAHSYVARHSWDNIRSLKWFDRQDKFRECPLGE